MSQASQKVQSVGLLRTALIGKKVRHFNSYNRKVILEIENVTVSHHHRQITPDTPENDWYGESVSWDTIKLHFVDGSSTEIGFGEDLEIINE